MHNLKGKLNKITFLLITLFLNSPTYSKSNQGNEKMEKQDKAEIETLLNKYQEALNTSDAKKAVSLYTKDGMFMPSEAPTSIGTENVLKAYEFVFSQIQLSIKFSIQEISIEGNFAFAVTSSKGEVLIRAANAKVPEENRELFIFEKREGVWKIARYMFNKVAPKG